MCFRQAARRTTLLCTASSGNNKQAIKFGTHHHPLHNHNSSSSAVVAASAASSTILLREFSAAAKKKKAINGDNKTNELSHQERKDAEKEQRRESWEKKQARLDRLKTRRDDSPKDVKKTLFRSWWDKELLYHDKLHRMAKKEGKPWRIRVAAMVERLPVVTPDVEEWEREYLDLRDYLMTFGKEYPAETGFMFAPDKPEDHVVESDEELIGKLLLLLLYCWGILRCSKRVRSFGTSSFDQDRHGVFEQHMYTLPAHTSNNCSICDIIFIAGLPFTPAPRETEADASGDVKALDRQLKTRLYLTIKSDAEGNVSGSRWTLPSTIAKKDESLLAAAERAVSDSVGSELKLWCPSNAPMAVNMRVYNDKLPESFRENYFGEKIFYYRVQYDNTGGGVDESAIKADDYAWLTREEIVERIEEERGKHQAKFFHYML